MVVTLDAAAPATAVRVGARPFRADIQGLRAVAVLAVLGFHAGVPGLSGGFVGVDVFFVISGYLITGLILREVAATGRLDLAAFWARRARRLLPASALVLATVAVLTLVALPVTRWASVAWDVVAGSLYVLNWRLARQSTDYLASEDAASPVQHFWSLGVEEQFYVVWPVLIIALVALRRRMGWRLRPTLACGLVLLAAPSFAWSVGLTASDPGPAYFVSTTRAWELAVGAALAVLPSRLLRRMPRPVAEGLGWAGLAAIVATVVWYDKGTPFPGWAALAPTLGAACSIAVGTRDRRLGATRLLGTAPMRGVGALSYSLYLWHWPAIVVATALWAGTGSTLPVPVAVAVLAASVVPAWLTYRFVEGPLHRAPRLARRRPAAVLAAVCAAVGLAAGGGVAVAADRSVPGPPPAGGASPGAAVLGDDPASDPDGRVVDRVARMTPDPVSAARDLGGFGGKSCIKGFAGATDVRCEYGPADAAVTVAVVGDSKMHQWAAALARVADARGWRVVTSLKDACPLVRVPMVGARGGPYDDCAAVNAQRYAWLLGDSPIDYVLTSQHSQRAYLPGRPDAEAKQAMVDDLRRTWTDLTAAGRRVVVMLDNPDPQRDILECVAEHGEQLSACAFPRGPAEAAAGSAAQRAALRLTPGVAAVDLADWICPGSTCPAVIGDVLVYRKGSHLTATYVATLTPRLDAALARVMRR